MKLLKSISVTSALLLTGGMAFAAPQQSKSNKAHTPKETRTYQAQNMNNNGGTRANANANLYLARGTITSVSKTKLVVKHQYMGKTEHTSFKITPNTIKEGKIKKGTHVVVYYENKGNGKHIAKTVKQEAWRG